MEKIYNWGILGAGRIAHKMAKAIGQSTRGRLLAVCSRSQEKARAFAAQYDAPHAYGSYEALASDPEVDIIYIATPHPYHREQTLLSLQHGKAVLCEKPMGLNLAEVKEMVAAAQDQGVFLMEAIWTRFHPNILKALEWIEAGRLGEVKYLRADFGFYTEFDPESRLYSMELGGGTVLDIGIYPLFLAQLIFGRPEAICALADLSPTGSDVTCSMLLQYPGQRMAHCHSTVAVDTNIEAEIYGTEARLLIHNRWHEPGKISLYQRNTLLEEMDFPEELGYVYEVEEVMTCLDQGLLESPALPHTFSMDLVRTMDKIRKQCGIRYPGE